MIYSGSNNQRKVKPIKYSMNFLTSFNSSVHDDTVPIDINKITITSVFNEIVLVHVVQVSRPHLPSTLMR